MKLIKMPENNIHNIPRALRKMADQIENGEFGDCHNLAWVIDCGNGATEIGLLGLCAEAAPSALLLFEIARHKIIQSALNQE